MTNELIQKAKACKSADELLALAKENNYPMTEEDAERIFAELHTEGEVSEEELDNVSGGACHIKVGGEKYTVVTNHVKCFNGCYERGFTGDEFTGAKVIRKDNGTLRSLWMFETMWQDKCGSCLHLEFKNGTGYCGKS